MHSLVGTPDYIAPEVFNRTGYTEIIDWWSVGAILFEMLVGYAPFCSDNQRDTCKKVVQWKKYLHIPSNISLPRDAADLIFRMMSEESRRSFSRHQAWKEWYTRNQRPPFLQEH
jgi:serine/threonine kinase 38